METRRPAETRAASVFFARVCSPIRLQGATLIDEMESIVYCFTWSSYTPLVLSCQRSSHRNVQYDALYGLDRPVPSRIRLSDPGICIHHARIYTAPTTSPRLSESSRNRKESNSRIPPISESLHPTPIVYFLIRSLSPTHQHQAPSLCRHWHHDSRMHFQAPFSQLLPDLHVTPNGAPGWT